MTGHGGDDRLAEVRQGMSVVDVDGEEAGTVEVVQMGDRDAVTTEGEGRPSGGLLADIAGAFTDTTPDVHPQLAARLVRTGYIKIDRGIGQGARYAAADQVSDVSEDVVRLTVPARDLGGTG
jgi:hypothetical protein